MPPYAQSEENDRKVHRHLHRTLRFVDGRLPFRASVRPHLAVHTAWVDDNDEYDPTRKPDGNAIKGIEDTMELLRDYKSLDDSTVVVLSLIHI